MRHLLIAFPHILDPQTEADNQAEPVLSPPKPMITPASLKNSQPGEDQQLWHWHWYQSMRNWLVALNASYNIRQLVQNYFAAINFQLFRAGRFSSTAEEREPPN